MLHKVHLLQPENSVNKNTFQVDGEQRRMGTTEVKGDLMLQQQNWKVRFPARTTARGGQRSGAVLSLARALAT